VIVPQRFTDPAAEHLATRRAAGLFDFSFMGCVEIAGNRAYDCLDHLQTRNLAALEPGRIAYTLLLREDGSVLNDATVWNLGAGRYALFTGRPADLAHVERLAAGYAVSITDRSSDHAVLALQGPEAGRILRECLAPEALPEVPYYGFASVEFHGTHCWLARMGYSGAGGYELIVSPDTAVALWKGLAAAGGPWGLAECGFEAADTLRIEAGHLLFARELATPVLPSEVGLARLVEPYGRNFCGASTLTRAPRRRLVGLLPYSRSSLTRERLSSVVGAAPAQVRAGTAVMTSACYSPTFEDYLALGYVDPDDRYPGTVVTLGGGLSARVARLPFYDPAKFLARRIR
jgi:aminomethyltransferase